MPYKARPLVAMTSSGIGGANGHCVIQGPPQASVSISSGKSFWRAEVEPDTFLLVVGGLSPRSTSSLSQSLQESLQPHSAADVALTYGRVSRSMTWRSWGVLRGHQPVRFSEPTLVPKDSKHVVFVFSGQGPQHLESMSPEGSDEFILK
jgi:acyl transferase domain-containing protein